MKKKFFIVTATEAVTGCNGSDHVFPEGEQQLIVAENTEEAEMQFLATMINKSGSISRPQKDPENQNSWVIDESVLVTLAVEELD